MTDAALTHTTVFSRLVGFGKAVLPSRSRKTLTDAARQESRERRDFALEMLDRNPDAFQSELDIEQMAHLYRCKY